MTKDNRTIAELFANAQNALDELKAKLIADGVIEDDTCGGPVALGPGAGDGGGGGEDPPVSKK
jgi:hypothetical protein